MYFCFRPSACLIMTQSHSHPQREVIHHSRYIQDLECLFQDQPLSNVEQRTPSKFHCNSAQWTIPRSMNWSSHQVHETYDIISVEGSGRLCQRIDNQIFASFGHANATLSFQHDCQYFEPVFRSSLNADTQHSAHLSTCSLDTDCLDATLQISLLGFDLCHAHDSMCPLEQNSNPAADSPGHWKHPNLKMRFVLRSVGFLKSNI